MNEQYKNPLGGDFSREVPVELSQQGDLEKRREKLNMARESIIKGSHLHVIDDVDIF